MRNQLTWAAVGLAAAMTVLTATTALAVDYTVNTFTDAAKGLTASPSVCETAAGNGICTLRAAVQTHNSVGGTNRALLSTSTYTLTLPGPSGNTGATGDLPVTVGNLTILGTGQSSTIVDASQLSNRAFDVFSTAIATVQDLTIRGGTAPSGESGGGIRNAGQLTLARVTVTNNSAAGSSGG